MLTESPQTEIAVERFEWVAASASFALLRLQGSLEGAERPIEARLIAYPRGVRRELGRVQGFERNGRSWSCAFSAPYELIRQPGTRFVLKLTGIPVVPLPAPSERPLRPASAGEISVAGGLARRTARAGVGALAGVALGLVAWAGVVVIRGGSPAVTQRSGVTDPQPAISTAPASPRPRTATLAVPAGESLTAEARVRRVAVYPSAAAKRPKMTLSNPNWDGAPLVLLVASVRADRLQVRLPTRPNLSMGWISRSEVRLALDPYQIAVQLRRHRMLIRRRGKLVQRYPVGVGRRAVTPTPFGLYYITELLKQPNPTGIYGPYAFGLSAHSDVLHEFAGGNGEIGIHGTDQPWAVGSDVSHGCIRVYNSVIRLLARELPLGTPVRIEA